jgi:hypothetical protein
MHNVVTFFSSHPSTHVEHKHDSSRMKSSYESKWSNDEMECILHELVTVTQPYG